MRFNLSVTALLAMAASTFAQTADFDPVNTPDTNQVIAAGSVFTITWDAPPKYADGTISISLIGGKTQNTQVPLSTIATGVMNSVKTFAWHVDASLGSEAVYGLVFKLESNPAVFQYSKPFHIQAGSTVPSVTSISATTTVTTSIGIKTITLSSQSTTAPSATWTSASIWTSSSAVSTTGITVVLNATVTVPCSNTTTLATVTRMPPPQTTSQTVLQTTPETTPQTTPGTIIVTSTAWAAPSNPPNATAPISTPPTVGAGVRVGASSLAFVCGLLMASLAL